VPSSENDASNSAISSANNNSVATGKNFINTERQFSLGIINDAFSLGFHSWWILGFVLSFCLFTVILAFVAGVIDNGRLPDSRERAEQYQVLWNNLGYDERQKKNDNDVDRQVFETMDRLTRLEGARKALAYPLLR
jgi:hypothetical protein